MKQWSGVFPATTTQFAHDERLDVSATQKVVDALIKDGVNGIICMGTVGENCSLSGDEKRTVLAAVKEVAGGGAGCPAWRRTPRRSRPVLRATAKRLE
jgi:4-hydroxy-tetrahydrodipicolinate synthase